VYGFDKKGNAQTITGDHDIFDITTPHGSRLDTARQNEFVTELMDNDMGVQHPAHRYWYPYGSLQSEHFQEN
jgi:hypothetical protein